MQGGYNNMKRRDLLKGTAAVHMTDQEKIDLLRQALLVLLGDMDFRANNCSMTEMVGAVVNSMTFDLVDRALRETA